MIKTCPILFNDPEYYGIIEPEHLCLSYTIGPTALNQARFQNRLTAEPTINLSEYEIKAVFDWLEIYLQTKGTHQARNIQPWLGKQNATMKAFKSCFVGGPTRATGHKGNSFVIRFQEPRPAGLRLLLRAILDRYCSEGTEFEDLSVTGLELSLDVYPAKTFAVADEPYAVRRMLMTQLLHKHILIHEAHREEKCRPRFTYGSEDPEEDPPTDDLFAEPAGPLRVKLAIDARELGIPALDLAVLHPKLHRQPYLDATLYYGQRDKRLFYRCMDKITDERSSSGAKKLPIEQTRSRIELTFIDQVPLDRLGPASVDLNTVEDIGRRGLEGFNEFLQFGLPTFTPSTSDPAEPNQGEWEVFSKSGVAGLAYFQDVQLKVEAAKSGKKLRDRKGLMSTGQCRRYSDLNRRVSKAFAGLQKTWEREWGRDY